MRCNTGFEKSALQYRWFALADWYPVGNDFSITLSWWSTLDSSSRHHAAVADGRGLENDVTLTTSR